MEPSIIQVCWGRTFSLEPYEMARLDVTARVDEGQDWREVLKAIKQVVREQEQIARTQYTSRATQNR
jgi:hypothetical protein